MKDNCNREIKHIRFSVTSNCNYQCIYCDREGFLPKTTELSVNEITQLCRILAQVLKVTKIKFTGGEPLLREEIVEIIRNVSDLQLYKDISMTTNGIYLLEKAQDLYDAGLNRINVSLGTLKPDIYKKIYGSNSLEVVLKGLTKAKEIGLTMAIGTDAHHADQMEYLPLGVYVAQRGWLEKKNLINTLSYDKLVKLLKKWGQPPFIDVPCKV